MKAHILESLSRHEIEWLIDAAIAKLDAFDGDPDFEDDGLEPEEADQNGDEQDFNGGENSPFNGRLIGGCGI